MTTRLVIVGLGLIGGSVALGARERGLFDRIVALELPGAVSAKAAQRAVDELADARDRAARQRAFSSATLCVLAAPVHTIASLVGEALDAAQVVTDCGSTKRAIARAALPSPHRDRFVPGHPMAGAPEGGFAQARPDLFQGSRWILCPGAASAPAVARVERLVSALGAEPVRMSAAEHDRAVALTSHVPQLLGSLLQVMSVRRGTALAAGPAFERATRGAGGGEAMWRDIFATNADEIASVLGELSAELGELADALSAVSPELSPALALLAAARGKREA